MTGAKQSTLTVLYEKTCRLLNVWLLNIPAEGLASQLLPCVVLSHKGPGFSSRQTNCTCLPKAGASTSIDFKIS